MRIVKPKPSAEPDTNNNKTTGGSPRMNSSGKVMFQSLERSSRNPSSFNGDPRFKQKRVMERSYSALNVVLVRGSSKSASAFGFFSSSSPQKSANGGSSNGHRSNGRSKKTD
ncbi:hypothetical protein V6N13_051134 [Hibiscus sabdariffa]|uniref:Uncharacterized protein n=1 Tax=Hibiscus sabdariffa TaxID=183260 RepID=A0ABR2T2W9_9ROSI